MNRIQPHQKNPWGRKILSITELGITELMYKYSIKNGCCLVQQNDTNTISSMLFLEFTEYDLCIFHLQRLVLISIQ